MEVIFEDVVMNNHTFSMIWRGMHFDQNILWFKRQAPISLQDIRSNHNTLYATMLWQSDIIRSVIHFDIFAFVCNSKYQYRFGVVYKSKCQFWIWYVLIIKIPIFCFVVFSVIYCPVVMLWRLLFVHLAKFAF